MSAGAALRRAASAPGSALAPPRPPDDDTVPDLIALAASTPVSCPDGVVPFFACSMSRGDGGGSLAITSDAVYLGEHGELTRIPAIDIRSWASIGRGPVFALTLEGDRHHVTHLFEQVRAATVLAMTKVVGPEGVRLRSA